MEEMRKGGEESGAGMGKYTGQEAIRRNLPIHIIFFVRNCPQRFDDGVGLGQDRESKGWPVQKY